MERLEMVHLSRAVRKYLQYNWKRVLLGLMSICVFVVAWHTYAWYLDTNDIGTSAYIPYPATVADTFLASFVTEDPVTRLFMWEHILSSLKRIVLGFGLALAVALPAGLLMGAHRGAEAVGKPIVEVFRPIPPLAWIPVFLVVFGILWGPVAIVFLGIFFPILLNVMFGVRSVDPVLIDAARTLGANRGDVFLKVILPFTLPYLMTGIKVGLGIGWMCIVAAEMLGAVGGGVGYIIFASAGIARYDYMYASMLVIGLLSVLTTGIAEQFEERLYKSMGMK